MADNRLDKEVHPEAVACGAAVPATEERQTLLQEGGRSSVVVSNERHTLVREGMREGRNSRAGPSSLEPVRVQ